MQKKVLYFKTVVLFAVTFLPVIDLDMAKFAMPCVTAKNYSGAIADFSSAIKLGSPTAKMYAQRADMYNKIKRPDLAKKDMEQVNAFSKEMLNLE